MEYESEGVALDLLATGETGNGMAVATGADSEGKTFVFKAPAFRLLFV